MRACGCVSSDTAHISPASAEDKASGHESVTYEFEFCPWMFIEEKTIISERCGLVPVIGDIAVKNILGGNY